MENLKSEKELLANLERLRNEKNYNDLFAFAEKSFANFPDSFPLKLLYAETLAENGKLNEADNILKDLMAAYPDNIKLLLVKGKIDFGLSRYNEAVESFNKILFLDPFNHHAKEWLVKIDKLVNVKPSSFETVKTPIMGARAGKPVRTQTDAQAVVPGSASIRAAAGAQPPPPVPPPIPTGETGKVKKEPTTVEQTEVDTTPYTGQAKPEIKTKKPDLDTKKVIFTPPAGGKPGQPPTASGVKPPPVSPPIPPPKKTVGEPTGLEFDIPFHSQPIKPLFTSRTITPQKMDEDTKKVPFITKQPPTLSEEEFAIPAFQQTGDEEPLLEFDIPGLDLSDKPPPIPSAAAPTQKPSIETKKVPTMPKAQVEQIQQEKEFGIPTLPEPAQEKIEIEYEIPGQEPMPAQVDFAADTLVEVDIPPIPKMEQGPVIPPPTVSAPAHGLEDVIPSVQEEYPQEIEAEYESPNSESFPQPEPEEEFDITASMQAETDEVEIEYEIPTEGSFSQAEDEFEIPASIPAASEEVEKEYEIPPTPTAAEVEEDFETPPGPMPDERMIEITASGLQPETEYSRKQAQPMASRGKEEEGIKEEVGGRPDEETEFMTESAAELYLSQGLFDDALTIYEKLYRAHKDEKYLIKMKELSRKRIAQKKIQALTRMLMLIEKKGEHRV